MSVIYKALRAVESADGAHETPLRPEAKETTGRFKYWLPALGVLVAVTVLVLLKVPERLFSVAENTEATVASRPATSPGDENEEKTTAVVRDANSTSSAAVKVESEPPDNVTRSDTQSEPDADSTSPAAVEVENEAPDNVTRSDTQSEPAAKVSGTTEAVEPVEKSPKIDRRAEEVAAVSEIDAVEPVEHDIETTVPDGRARSVPDATKRVATVDKQTPAVAGAPVKAKRFVFNPSESGVEAESLTSPFGLSTAVNDYESVESRSDSRVVDTSTQVAEQTTVLPDEAAAVDGQPGGETETRDVEARNGTLQAVEPEDVFVETQPQVIRVLKSTDTPVEEMNDQAATAVVQAGTVPIMETTARTAQSNESMNTETAAVETRATQAAQKENVAPVRTEGKQQAETIETGQAAETEAATSQQVAMAESSESAVGETPDPVKDTAPAPAVEKQLDASTETETVPATTAMATTNRQAGSVDATKDLFAEGQEPENIEEPAAANDPVSTRVSAGINAVTVIAARTQRLQLLKSQLSRAMSERNGSEIAAILQSMQEMLGGDSLYVLKARASAELAVDGDSKRAKSLLQEVLVRDPGDKEARVNLAAAEINLGQTGAARKRLKALADEYPEDRKIGNLLESIQ